MDLSQIWGNVISACKNVYNRDYRGAYRKAYIKVSIVFDNISNSRTGWFKKTDAYNDHYANASGSLDDFIDEPLDNTSHDTELLIAK